MVHRLQLTLLAVILLLPLLLVVCGMLPGCWHSTCSWTALQPIQKILVQVIPAAIKGCSRSIVAWLLRLLLLKAQLGKLLLHADLRLLWWAMLAIR